MTAAAERKKKSLARAGTCHKSPYMDKATALRRIARSARFWNGAEYCILCRAWHLTK